MFSRTTLWRRKKQLKKILVQMLENTNSSCDENWLRPTLSEVPNNNGEVDLLTETQSLNPFESQSHLFTSMNEDKSEDESDIFVDQMWLEEAVDNIDPWKNVELEPIFPYPVEDNEFLFRDTNQNPTEKEISAALILLKIRHRISTKCIDHLCKLLKLLKTPNSPMNFSRVKRLFLSNSSPTPSSLITYICSVCCEASSSSEHCNNIKCTEHSSFSQTPLHFLRLSILPQLQEILDRIQDLNFEQQRSPSSSDIDMIDDIYDGKAYQNIIKEQRGKEFLSFIMNADGIQVAKSSNTSLWIFTLVINEIKRSDRFKLKNVIIGGIVSTTSKPNRHQMQALLAPIVDELLLLEKGQGFEVNGLNANSHKYLKCFLIASCCDKPAQSLVQGISEPIGAFGCGRCELEGITVPIKPNSTKKMRVFPLLSEHQQQPRLRTNETYDKYMNIYRKKHFINDTERRDRLRGHISPCVLRDLTYFDVGSSFLSDSLHNIYHGVVKRLLHLWLDKKYRKQSWSIYGKLKIVNHYLSSIKYPSTSIRIPRSLSKYEQFKANETRAILLFGFSGFCAVLPIKYAKHLLLLVVGIHIAESRRIHCTQVEDIRILLNEFLQLFPTLYTPRHNTQSVHSLNHVAESVLEYGSLSNYSSFNFENILGLITSTVHSTCRHSYEIYNNLKLLRLACIEFDRPTFNRGLKEFINITQSSKRLMLSSSTNDNKTIHFRLEDTNKDILIELQDLLRQSDIELFKTCFIFTNRFSVMRYCSASQKNDSCLLFLFAGKPCIGFIQNIIKIRRDELILRICKVNIKDQLSLTFNNKKLSCPNIFYGDLDMNNNRVFIKPEAIIEKIVHVYNKQLKCYIFCRIPNLCESS